jgi:hypothetical protein
MIFTFIVMSDGSILNFTSTPRPPANCTTDYEATLVFDKDAGVPTTAEARQSETFTYPIPSYVMDDANYNSCFRPVEGRPYMDVHGRQISAAVMQEQKEPAWSSITSLTTTINDRDETLGNEWAERALGEHASVPAFAAFTIALMSNNAPPELVQDALTAAMDEVRHATTSFEVASLLLGKTMEPGPLPPTSLNFGNNMTALALAAAKEGCVDETLSALVAGFEVDFNIDQNPRISDTTKSILKEKIRTIAMEETRHSALAWRTVRWACEVDADACVAVKKEVFDDSYLKQAFTKRFTRFDHGGLEASDVWEDVHGSLIPLVSGNKFDSQALASACVHRTRQLEDTETSFLEQMGNMIIHEFVCNLH